MTIAERLTEAGAWPDHDSRCTPIAIPDPDGPGYTCQWIATTGDPQNDEYGIADITEEEHAGHWIIIVHGTDETVCWWNENEEEWQEGEPS
jgi:hypothetical protein